MKKKKILVDINHPAHVHLFKYFIDEMQSKGYKVIVAAKNVNSIKTLLQTYKIDYIDTGQKKDNMVAKYIYELFHLLKLIGIVAFQRVDYGIGVSMVLPIVSRLTRMKSVALDDDDMTVTPLFGKAISLADTIFTPSSLAFENRGNNHISHQSFHELAYLHPARFKPDPSVMREIGILPGETYFILRFNVFKAHHDTDAIGLTLKQKLVLIELLKPYGRIFITTERTIDPELEPYRMPVSPEKIHTLMYHATMFIGDSQTMISEAALLGTPAVKLNSFAGRLSVPNEIEQRYELCYSFLPRDFDHMLSKVRELLEIVDLKAEWSQRKERMLADKIDLTAFLVEFISNYPASFNELKSNAAHQYAL
ncbi:DUF354 domain-containing protein [Spirosoma aerolatum]|uniref:DUF354 domain-containing protein n=1 Tax=Spirosoma aerolatum TaxID=1211326 RepID=UPI0009AC61E9|nr:DUF354 domain-containing protein [Spirosoma aerolatum]